MHVHQVNQAQDLMSVTKIEDFPNSLLPNVDISPKIRSIKCDEENKALDQARWCGGCDQPCSVQPNCFMTSRIPPPAPVNHPSYTTLPASATTREKFAWNYLSRCDGDWATQERQYPHSDLGLDLVSILLSSLFSEHTCCHWIKDCTQIVVLCISTTKQLILLMWTVDTGQTQKLQKKRNIDSQQFILSTEWSVSLGGERV